METVFLLLGTNMGDRLANLSRAIELLRKLGLEIRQVSSVYKTAPWGKENQPEFYNQVVEIATALPAEDLLDVLLKTEEKMGRVRREKWGERLIDIDILLYGNTIINTPQLMIPHPQLPFRRFTLIPLAELAGDYLHPGMQKTIAELLRDCPDPLDVSLIQ